MSSIRLYNKLLPANKKVYIALTIIYGIGIKTSKKICKNIGLPENLKVNQLQKIHHTKIIKHLKKLKDILENSLKSKRRVDIENLIEIKSRRGLRHKNCLPVRGQRTCTNAKTRTKHLRGQK